MGAAMKRCAVVDGDIVINVIVAEQTDHLDGSTLVELYEGQRAEKGWRYVNGQFIDPAPQPTAEELSAAKKRLIAAGML